MLLSYLVLAHLLGDFILQPSKLVKWKMHSKWGTFTHVVIHLVTSLVIILPFLLEGYFELLLVVAVINVIHFFIDETKINYDLKHDEKVKPFIVDQSLHFLTILVAYLFLADSRFILPNSTFHQFYTDIRIINFISFFIFITSAVEIYRFTKRRETCKNARLVFHKKEVTKRTLIFTLLYIALMVISTFAFSRGGF